MDKLMPITLTIFRQTPTQGQATLQASFLPAAGEDLLKFYKEQVRPEIIGSDAFAGLEPLAATEKCSIEHFQRTIAATINFGPKKA